MVWFGVGLLAVVLVAAGARSMRRGVGGAGGSGFDPELGRLTARLFGQDWARRYGWAAPALVSAFTRGTPAALLTEVGRHVGVVHFRFHATDARASTVEVEAIVDHADGARSTATVGLSWDDLPASVRGDLLRGDAEPVFRQWRAVPQPSQAG